MSPLDKSHNFLLMFYTMCASCLISETQISVKNPGQAFLHSLYLTFSLMETPYEFRNDVYLVWKKQNDVAIIGHNSESYARNICSACIADLKQSVTVWRTDRQTSRIAGSSRYASRGKNSLKFVHFFYLLVGYNSTNMTLVFSFPSMKRVHVWRNYNEIIATLWCQSCHSQDIQLDATLSTSLLHCVFLQSTDSHLLVTCIRITKSWLEMAIGKLRITWRRLRAKCLRSC